MTQSIFDNVHDGVWIVLLSIKYKVLNSRDGLIIARWKLMMRIVRLLLLNQVVSLAGAEVEVPLGLDGGAPLVL